jgi:hypothetical protein
LWGKGFSSRRSFGKSEGGGLGNEEEEENRSKREVFWL